MLALIMGILADAIWEAFDVAGFVMVPPPMIPHWEWNTFIGVGLALPIISAAALISQYCRASRERRDDQAFFVIQLARQREDIVDALTNKIQSALQKPEPPEKKVEEISQDLNLWAPPQISPAEYLQRRQRYAQSLAWPRQRAIFGAYVDSLKKDPGKDPDSKSGNSS